MKRTRWVIGLAIVGIIGGAAYFRTTAEAETPRYVTASVTRGAVVAKVEATGTLQPVDTVEVGTQVTGTIKALNADFNSVVRKGQVIATLDPAVLQSQVDQARATVVRLRADLERAKVGVRDADVKLARAKSLAQAQLLPQSDLDTAQVTYDSAVASVKSAEAQLLQAQASLDQSQVTCHTRSSPHRSTASSSAETSRWARRCRLASPRRRSSSSRVISGRCRFTRASTRPTSVACAAGSR
jgi:HlyD family secretion protein